MKMAPTTRLDGTPIMGLVTPCCGARQWLFPDEQLTCMMCGTPLQLALPERERDLSHLMLGGPLTRYVS